MPKAPLRQLPRAPVVKEAEPEPVQQLVQEAANDVEEEVTLADTGAAPDQGEPHFLQDHVLRVPVVGKYASALLQLRWVKPLVKRADPYVEKGAEKIMPYVQAAAARPIVQRSVQLL